MPLVELYEFNPYVRALCDQFATAMAKRGSEAIETQEAENKRRKWIETQGMKKHTILVSTLADSEITLKDVLGFTCLSYVRQYALRALRRLPSGDEFKGRSEWEYVMVRGSTVLPTGFIS